VVDGANIVLGAPARRAAEPTVLDASPTMALTDKQISEAVRLYESNYGQFEGLADFKPCVPGTEIINQKCELCDGVLERYRRLEQSIVRSPEPGESQSPATDEASLLDLVAEAEAWASRLEGVNILSEGEEEEEE
jgi:hypothetical protein